MSDITWVLHYGEVSKNARQEVRRNLPDMRYIIVLSNYGVVNLRAIEAVRLHDLRAKVPEYYDRRLVRSDKNGPNKELKVISPGFVTVMLINI